MKTFETPSSFFIYNPQSITSNKVPPANAALPGPECRRLPWRVTLLRFNPRLAPEGPIETVGAIGVGDQ